MGKLLKQYFFLELHDKFKNIWMFIFTRPATSKIGEVVILAEGLPLTWLHAPLITGSHDVTYQIQNAIGLRLGNPTQKVI